MIDRQARDNLAERLRHLASGTMTNYVFEDTGIRSEDAVIDEIESRLAWPCYDDTPEHRLSGSHALTDGARLDFARAILFLKSDLPYEWRLHRGIRGLLSRLFREALPEQRGDMCVWPFFRESDYREALQRQPYLHGNAHPSDGANAALGAPRSSS